MSRTTPNGPPPIKPPAGDLAAVTIGLETLLLPRAVAHKVLPLLEKGVLADRGYCTSRRRLDARARRGAQCAR